MVCETELAPNIEIKYCFFIRKQNDKQSTISFVFVHQTTTYHIPPYSLPSDLLFRLHRELRFSEFEIAEFRRSFLAIKT